MVLSDNRPPVKSGYDLDYEGLGYRKCGAFPGAAMAGMPNRLDCADGAIGQYLYVYLPVSDYITICEAEAYGTRKYNNDNDKDIDGGDEMIMMMMMMMIMMTI